MLRTNLAKHLLFGEAQQWSITTMAYLNTAFKTDPLAFLQQHPFIWRVIPPNGGFVGDQGYFDIHDNNGFDMIETAATQNVGAENSIHAYYLHYQDNQTFTLDLGSAADYMFTPVMTGCTFVVSDGWLYPKVSHINYQFPIGHLNAGTIDQPQMDTVATNVHPTRSWFNRHVLRWNVRKIVKNDYISATDQLAIDNGTADPIKMIIVGIRGYTGWYFYRVRFRDHGGGNLQTIGNVQRI